MFAALGNLELQVVTLYELLKTNEQLKVRINPKNQEDEYFINMLLVLGGDKQHDFTVSEGVEVVEQGKTYREYFIYRGGKETNGTTLTSGDSSV